MCRVASDVVFTRKCEYCGRATDMRREVCEKCCERLIRMEGERCGKCGNEKDKCTCMGKVIRYKSVYAPFYYEGPAGLAVKQLKFYGRQETAQALARDMAETFFEHYGDVPFDMCTYVPLSKKKLRERGYNQSRLLAEALCEHIGLPCVATMDKIFETRDQHKLKGSLRSGNVAGVMEARKDVSLEGAIILIVDDIKTTGATLDECAKALIVAGAEEIYCLTATVTKGRPND